MTVGFGSVGWYSIGWRTVGIGVTVGVRVAVDVGLTVDVGVSVAGRVAVGCVTAGCGVTVCVAASRVTIGRAVGVQPTTIDKMSVREYESTKQLLGVFNLPSSYNSITWARGRSYSEQAGKM